MPGLCARQYVDVALALSIHETTEATHDTPYAGESRILDYQLRQGGLTLTRTNPQSD